MTKADIIRSFLRRFPEETPSALVDLIKAENKDMKLVPQEVSTIKSKMKSRELATINIEQEEEEEEPMRSDEGSLAEKLARLKEAADAVGGVDEAKRILDMLR